MPGAPVGVPVAVEHGGQGLLYGAALQERRSPVDGRTYEWMAEGHDVALHPQQPGRLRLVERVRRHPQLLGRAQHEADVAALLGGGHEQQRLRRGRQPAHPVQEDLLDHLADRQPLGQRPYAGKLLGRERARQFEQGEGVARGAVHQQCGHLGSERHGRTLGQQRPRRLGLQPTES